MMRFAALLARFPDLAPAQITDWVARGWVRVDGASPEEWTVAEIEITRIHMIRDLRIGMDVQDDAIPVVLSLLDQVHSLRRALKLVAEALDHQPPALREAVLAALAHVPESSGQ